MRRRAFLSTAAGTLCASAGCALPTGVDPGPSAAVAWHHETGPEPTVAVGDDRVYLAGEGGVAALDRESGGVDWERPLAGVWELHHDAARDAVYAHGDVGLVALSTGDGATRWRVDGSYQSLYLADGTLTAYASGGYETVRVDPASGAVVWTWRGNLLDERTPRTALSYGEELTGVDLRDGTVAWSFDAGTGRTPVATHRPSGSLLVAVRTGQPPHRLVGLGLRSGEVRWERALPAGFHVGGLLGGRAYVTTTATETERTTVDAVDPASGERYWRRDVGTRAPDALPTATQGDGVVFTQWSYSGPLSNTLVLARDDGHTMWSRQDHAFVTAEDDRVVVQSDMGHLEGVDPDGDAAWETQMDAVPVAEVNGRRIYDPPEVGTREGAVVAGFRGSNRVASRSTETGQLRWEVLTEDVFRDLLVRGRDVYALGDRRVDAIRVS